MSGHAKGDDALLTSTTAMDFRHLPPDKSGAAALTTRKVEQRGARRGAGKSAGILLWKRDGDALIVLLVHPGGPFWKNKDVGAWSIPKGEYADDEDPLDAAKREFAEELGELPRGEITPLGEIRQKAGKVVTGFALEGDFDTANFKCNSFEIEWPPRSGKRASFPEIDRAEWVLADDARAKINPAQAELIERLEKGFATSSRAKSRRGRY